MKTIKAKTPRGAANEIARCLRKWNGSDEGIVVKNPAETKRCFDSECWSICWEGGPFEWAVALSGGSNLWAGEFGNYSARGDLDITAGVGWFAEPQNHFTLLFYKD